MANEPQNIINQIQAFNATITGVRFAPSFDKYPLTADSVRLPMVLTWPGGPNTWSRQGFGGKKRVDGVYEILVFCEALGQNTLPGRSQLATTLLGAFREAWLGLDASGYPTALSNAGTHQVTVEWDGTYPNDTGIQANMQIGATVYAGFQVNLKIRELW